MKKRLMSGLGATLLASLLIAASASANGSCGPDFETSTACPVNTAATTSYHGTSFANNETDYYVFYAQANAEFSATVLDEGNPDCGGGYCAGNQIELADAYGDVLAGGLYNDNGDTNWSEPIGSGYDNAGPLSLSYILKSAGTYYVKVEGGLDGNDPSPVPYALTMSATPNVQWPKPVIKKTSPPPKNCKAPKFGGASLATVKRRIVTNDCTVGRVRYRYGPWRKGTVVTSNRRAGVLLPYHSPISLTVSKGHRPKPRHHK